MEIKMRTRCSAGSQHCLTQTLYLT